MADKTQTPWLHTRIVARATASHTMPTAKTKEGEEPIVEHHHWLAIRFASGDVVLLKSFGDGESVPDMIRIRSQPNPQRAFTMTDAMRAKAGISADTYADLNAGLRASEEASRKADNRTTRVKK